LLSGFIYFLGGVFMVEGVAAVVWGKAISVWSYLAGYWLDPTLFVLTSRFLAVAASTATIYVTYLLGTRLAGQRAGLLGAAATAGSFLHVRDAHFGVTDSPLTFGIVLAVAVVAHAGRLRTRATAAISGALAGLALAIKYNAALLALPIIIAYLIQDGEKGRPYFSPAPGLLVISLATMLGVFVASTPYALLDWHTFVKDLSFKMLHLRMGHPSPHGDIIITARGWWHHASVNLRYGLGFPLLLAALAGLALRLRKPSAADLIVFAFPLAYYLSIGSGRTTFARYILPVVPFACVAAACTVDWLILLIHRHGKPHLATVGGILCMGLLLAPSLGRAVQFDSLLRRPDTREVLHQWIRINVPPGTHITWLGSRYTIPFYLSDPTPQADSKDAVWREAVTHLNWSWTGPNYTIHIRGVKPLYLWGPLHLWEPLNLVKPEFVVLATGPPQAYTVPTEAVPFLLPPERYEKVFAIDPFRPEGPPLIYDPQDAFFIPLSGLVSLTQPGPALTVYRLRSKSHLPKAEP
jgi:hypothetical protein